MTLVASPRPATRRPTPCAPPSSTAPDDIRVEDGPAAPRRRRRGRDPRHARRRSAAPTSTSSRASTRSAGLVIGHEPVGVIEELGAGVTGYEIGQRVLVGAITPCGQCRACLSGNLSQCGHGERLRGPRRLALRQHDQRRAGRVPARPVRPGEPHAHPRRRHRRAGRPARRHRLDRLQRRRVGRRADRRRGRRLRPGPDRPVRDGRRQADGRVARHRRRQRSGPPRDGQADGRRRRPRLHAGRRRRRGQAPDRRRRGRDDRGARDAGDVRERPALPAAGRHAVEPRRLLGQARDAVRRVRRGPRRPPDRHDALPGRQGADAAAHRHGRSRVASTRCR